MLTQSVGHLGEEIARLRALKDSGDAPAFARAAHSIKGIAATFCAVRLQKAAQQLEALGFDDNLGAADAWIEQLEAERPGLEAYLKGLAPAERAFRSCGCLAPFPPAELRGAMRPTVAPGAEARADLAPQAEGLVVEPARRECPGLRRSSRVRRGSS